MRVFSEENSKVLLGVAFGRAVEEVKAFTMEPKFFTYQFINPRSLYISKTLNLNNFETESQMFTVIVVHKILVPF